MANHPKPKKILRGFLGSTEPGARQVMEANRPKKAQATKPKDTGAKTTAKSPFKAKTPAQTAAAKRIAIAKREATVRRNIKERQAKKKAAPKKAAKRKHYGGKMS